MFGFGLRWEIDDGVGSRPQAAWEIVVFVVGFAVGGAFAGLPLRIFSMYMFELEIR